MQKKKLQAMRSWCRALAGVAVAAALAGCGGGGTSAPAAPGLSPAAALGEKIFKDASLSASGRMSCATCHAPAAAHAQTSDLAVQLGGPALDVAGLRAVPSLRYLATAPAFFFAKNGTPTGGFNHDGSADSLLAQAMRPFLAAHEDRKSVV